MIVLNWINSENGCLFNCFFLLQLLIYTLALTRLRWLNRQDLPPDIKLKLIENEDPLWESGLYIGFGGTVLALLLFYLEWHDSSCAIAYASTFWGICFVAILRIVHIRPMKRALILKTVHLYS